jgi:hypothetical protein
VKFTVLSGLAQCHSVVLLAHCMALLPWLAVPPVLWRECSHVTFTCDALQIPELSQASLRPRMHLQL